MLHGLVLVAGVAIGAGDEAARSAETSSREPVVCDAGAVDVTVTLVYNRDDLGAVAGTRADVAFREPLRLPEPASPEKLRSRVTSLMASEYRVAPATDQQAGRLRVAMMTSEAGIPPGNAFKVHFDCPTGSHVRPTDLSCTTSEVVDGAGIPMADALARTVRCVVTRIAPSQ